MICKLCLQEKKLCRSHIIPEFFYDTLYDEKHTFVAVALSPTSQNRFPQKGLRDELLCANCETQLSRYEKYAKEILFDNRHDQFYENRVAYEYENLIYSRFKLFQLSLLWRAGVTSLPEFGDVNLGDHAERIRKMILSESPGEPHQYGCVMAILETKEKLEDTVMLMPRATRFAGHRGFMFMIRSLSLFYIVSSHSSSFAYRENFLWKNGHLIIQKDTERVIEGLWKDSIAEVVATENKRRMLRKSSKD